VGFGLVEQAVAAIAGRSGRGIDQVLSAQWNEFMGDRAGWGP
jgi:hypothetical protein